MNLDINLKAPFFLSKLAGAAMRRQGAGKIVNLGDWAGIRPYKDYLPYAVSKSGLIGLTKSLAKELAPEVQVNCIALGMVMPPEDYDDAEVARLIKRTSDTKDGFARRRSSRRNLLLRNRLRNGRNLKPEAAASSLVFPHMWESRQLWLDGETAKSAAEREARRLSPSRSRVGAMHRIFLILRCRVLPCRRSVKPTVGFTLQLNGLLPRLSPLRPQALS